MINPATLTTAQKQHMTRVWLSDRQRARTDLYWLANEVLSPPDSRIMVPHAHGIIVDHCQLFSGRREIADPLRYSKFGTPAMVLSQELVAMPDLPGLRDDMLLVSRGHLKTTINTVAHSIQWILNYPDVRILVVTSTDEKAQMIVGKIKQHFQFNPRFRFLFPEFCPDAKKASDWGSKTEFSVPNRNKRGDEPTMMTAAVGKALASTHHDVIKCSDVVTENNVKTKGQIDEVKEFIGYLDPLREKFLSRDGQPNPGWLTKEGTIYDFSDEYSATLDEITRGNGAFWRVTKQSCWVDKERRVPLWPERFPPAQLDRILAQIGPYLFASQYELEPVRAEDGLARPEEIRFFPAHVAQELMPRYRLYTTVDLASPEETSNGDFIVFTTAGIDRDGRIDVLSIQRGHFNDEQICNIFFNTDAVYGGKTQFKVQKDHFARMLAPLMRREMAKRGRWLNIEYTPISNRISKVQKIRGLQGFFRMGLIRFSDSIACRADLVMEIVRFPKGGHDDIIDTISDLLTDRAGAAVGDIIPDAPKWTLPIPRPEDRFLEFDPLTKEAHFLMDQMKGGGSYMHETTGAL